jgi:hypothetical protein
MRRLCCCNRCVCLGNQPEMFSHTSNAEYFAAFIKLYPSFLDSFRRHIRDLGFKDQKQLKPLKFSFVLLKNLSERNMSPDDFNALARKILDAKQKDYHRILNAHLSSVASGPTSTAAGIGQQLKNWLWGSQNDPVREQKLTELTPSEMMKIAQEQSARITDSEFLSRLDDRVPALQPLAIKAAECARSYLADLVTRSTTKLLHRARFCQEEACSRRVQQEATSKEADELKASRCQFIEEITEASRAYSSCVI